MTKMIETKEQKAVTRRRLHNGDHLSVTRVLKENHDFYHVSGKENYISVQVKILEFLKKNGFSTILESPLEEHYFLAKQYFPLLVETITRKYATNDYLKRNNFFIEGQVLPSITTEFLIYRDEDKKKHLLKSHGEELQGVYGRDAFNNYLGEEVNLKDFLGARYREAMEDMDLISQRTFSLMQTSLLPDLSELELEFSFERTKRFEGNLEIFSLNVMISDFDIELKDVKNVSHKKGANSLENETLNKNLLEILNRKLF
jgi:hypothetical protein